MPVQRSRLAVSCPGMESEEGRVCHPVCQSWKHLSPFGTLPYLQSGGRSFHPWEEVRPAVFPHHLSGLMEGPVMGFDLKSSITTF